MRMRDRVEIMLNGELAYYFSDLVEISEYYYACTRKQDSAGFEGNVELSNTMVNMTWAAVEGDDDDGFSLVQNNSARYEYFRM